MERGPSERICPSPTLQGERPHVSQGRLRPSRSQKPNEYSTASWPISIYENLFGIQAGFRGVAGKESAKRKRARLSVVFYMMKTIRLRDILWTFIRSPNKSWPARTALLQSGFGVSCIGSMNRIRKACPTFGEFQGYTAERSPDQVKRLGAVRSAYPRSAPRFLVHSGRRHCATSLPNAEPLPLTTVRSVRVVAVRED